uniref:Uncharacterized protein n=2 Tax=Odontella aurita TaxID=265563 RepID=A0A7S4IXC7_9STRA|mmetsp:Transcript_31671/g.94764  ORF Transcript_31671/g.94764 Transcript_31671/m.94764 type:complete len:140 (+) Transcript_31671:253-672(+)
MIERSVVSDDEKKTTSILERDLLAVACSADGKAMTVRCFDVTTEVESPSLAPKRLSCSPLSIAGPSAGRVELNGNGCGSEHENGGADDRPPPTKRPRTEEGSSAAASTRQNEGADRKQRPIFDEVEYLADRFENTIDQL